MVYFLQWKVIGLFLDLVESGSAFQKVILKPTFFELMFLHGYKIPIAIRHLFNVLSNE